MIHDFRPGHDRLSLREMDTGHGGPFVYLADAAFGENSPGQLRFENGWLYGNTDADSYAEFEIQLIGVSELTAIDLILG